ncbi:MAG: hypothetical protein M1818_004476 [Claussenomyces sp. TS43310]|nr:MAG: hypothetical protein M1818_004476 [Claussenomyces sp. TS43310]
MGEVTDDGPKYLKYSTIPGYFVQDDPSTDPFTFDYTKSFGLISRSYDTDADLSFAEQASQWQRFAHHLSRLPSQTGHKSQYKVLFLGRHGEGYHNVAQEFYGTAAWDGGLIRKYTKFKNAESLQCYWSHLDGNATSTWSDAQLTLTGIAQASLASQTWATEIRDHSMPAPTSYYSSPLIRCLQTAYHTFSPLKRLGLLPSPATSPFIPTIKELLREKIGVHTCDRRSTRSEIEEFWRAPAAPLDFVFEKNFSEKDELWDSEMRETDVGLDRRSRAILDDLFTNDMSAWLSISSHSGMIASLLRGEDFRDS